MLYTSSIRHSFATRFARLSAALALASCNGSSLSEATDVGAAAGGAETFSGASCSITPRIGESSYKKSPVRVELKLGLPIQVAFFTEPPGVYPRIYAKQHAKGEPSTFTKIPNEACMTGDFDATGEAAAYCRFTPAHIMDGDTKVWTAQASALNNSEVLHATLYVKAGITCEATVIIKAK